MENNVPAKYDPFGIFARLPIKNKAFEARLIAAFENPDLLDQLRMEASDRWREAGMKKAIDRKGKEQAASEIAVRLLKRNRSIDEIVEDTGLTAEEIAALADNN
jgi:hypothetical protein